MRTYLIILLACIGLCSPALAQEAESPAPEQEQLWSLVIHGGAGTIARDKITPEEDARIRSALDKALSEGSAVLADGGTAMLAVTTAITVLENSPEFNAGYGAVFTWDETNRLDASIMNGADRNAGAVAGVSSTKNPILLAREVMLESPHVMLAGAGADEFSREQGLTQVDPSYFATPRRLEQLRTFKARKAAGTPVSALDIDTKFGTVGAVAMDMEGNIVAGTSTGGMTGKRYDRIGDSPIIGAGTYADNRSCGVSATGAGEYFIRVGVAQAICTKLRFAAESNVLTLLNQAVDSKQEPDAEELAALQRNPLTADEVQGIADTVIGDMGSLGGSGGIIYVTPWRHIGYSFDTPGMYRGKASSDGMKSVAIYGDEE
ncbi:isoaspartyl peptidase/L-asparaginase family protein [Alterisphingorhabdus coralli]|uniref:Isoaspartyl peptidase/L-asparaginase n=1 Tax=Alterisphingorhabdus coralli TaxID=3071408 RepID=A0AA97FAR7_9SPHN|nr:isoaspartyl peptidase/L-asparaginase [Parasphingorhabdus sp. SCSIO 66989]WOE76182.1 isoaspartyl peptidase/L-asparaginase [Parasphingorhabdus sp. SCSIO 66989]